LTPNIVKMIALSNGKSAIVDPEDYERIKDVTWSVSTIGNTQYLMSRKMVGRKIAYTLLHRLIMGASPDQLVDHINGDGLDNRKGNLRIATKSQNAMNAKLRSDNTTGFKGVCYIPKRNRYSARIHANGKKYASAFYRTALEAAMAYKDMATSLHGEFMRVEGGGLL
jgi:hypothetical protein